MASIVRKQRQGRITWQARWRDPDGRQRKKTFTKKVDAERFCSTTEADKLRGAYIDPGAGKVTFKRYADEWLQAQTFDPSTRAAVELRLRVHAYPTLGATTLAQVRPSTIQAWLRGLEVADSYRRVIFANVSSIFAAAVDDERIAKNPCRAGSVRAPRVESRRVVPWQTDTVLAVRDALPDRYRVLVTLAAGLGLRQGEVFGLSPHDVDWLRGSVTVRRQVKLLGGSRPVFAPPKGGKTRRVPLPAASVRDVLTQYLAEYPAADVTLPWRTLDGDSVTVPLVVTSREAKPLNRNYVNSRLWKPALASAGVATTRENGMHALRHHYASVLLDAGESIKAVSEYLGHADPGFTLRVYTHLMPSSDERTRNAIDAALSGCAPSVPLAAVGGSD